MSSSFSRRRESRPQKAVLPPVRIRLFHQKSGFDKPLINFCRTRITILANFVQQSSDNDRLNQNLLVPCTFANGHIAPILRSLVEFHGHCLPEKSSETRRCLARLRVFEFRNSRRATTGDQRPVSPEVPLTADSKWPNRRCREVRIRGPLRSRRVHCEEELIRILRDGVLDIR